ncbi:MAG: hypothetical protein J6S05_11325 [Bacteroidaceae bacterium]|nr:hypothetical protein [Bacteroidaceae bacterium]
MKKLLLFLFMSAIVTFNLLAQEQSSHLKFKNIPITGTMQSVVSQLKTAGYKVNSQSPDFTLMDGSFANLNCEIAIRATPKSNIVYSIAVFFTESTSWYSLKSDYLEFKKLLKEKYQVSPRTTEEFIEPYYEGDGYELQATTKSKCYYYSIFDVKDGEIRLVILNKRLTLLYTDKYGDTINEREENENTLNDL